MHQEVIEEQKELVLAGERLVLTTLGFDLNIHHPYKPLVAAIKKFKVAQNTLAQVAWNFVNDGYVGAEPFFFPSVCASFYQSKRHGPFLSDLIELCFGWPVWGCDWKICASLPP